MSTSVLDQLAYLQQLLKEQRAECARHSERLAERLEEKERQRNEDEVREESLKEELKKIVDDLEARRGGAGERGPTSIGRPLLCVGRNIQRQFVADVYEEALRRIKQNHADRSAEIVSFFEGW